MYLPRANRVRLHEAYHSSKVGLLTLFMEFKSLGPTPKFHTRAHKKYKRKKKFLTVQPTTRIEKTNPHVCCCCYSKHFQVRWVHLLEKFCPKKVELFPGLTCWWFELLLVYFIHFYDIYINFTSIKVYPTLWFFT